MECFGLQTQAYSRTMPNRVCQGIPILGSFRLDDEVFKDTAIVVYGTEMDGADRFSDPWRHFGAADALARQFPVEMQA